MRSHRLHILFAAEDASLAQQVRLRQLAASLDPARYRVSFAAARFDPLVFGGTGFERHRLGSLPRARLERRLQLGLRLYDEATLAGYVRDELSLLEALQPDLVIGDLRLSLCVSAPKLGVPYAALINAYWNPIGGAASFPMPEHPLTQLLSATGLERKFHRALPWVLRHFAAPVNALRRRHGLPPVGDLLQVLTFGDQVLYPDLPALTPVEPRPSHHHFLGPVLWSPALELPPVSDAQQGPRPLVYVTLGSSGSRRALRVVLQALARMPVRVWLATAGRLDATSLPDNVVARPYLPGDQAAQAARLVICNGGSGTAYQALAEGTPVLGLPWNLDQYLCATAVERSGAGRLLRSASTTADQVTRAVQELLGDDEPRARARALADAMARWDSAARFGAWLERAPWAGPQDGRLHAPSAVADSIVA